MSAERLRSPEQLIGKSIIEIISLLPTFSWYINLGTENPRLWSHPQITSLTVVDYETKPPVKLKTVHDIFGSIEITPGAPVDTNTLAETLIPKPNRTTGLISRVGLSKEWFGKGYHALTEPWAHIPFIDFDVKRTHLSQKQLVDLIKTKIREDTELTKGMILKSGKNNHFHFIGTERLLTEVQFVSFLGFCGMMRDEKGQNLVDRNWVSHSLVPCIYFRELDRQFDIEGSRYDFGWRFATLRITTSKKKPQLPVVVDVL